MTTNTLMALIRGRTRPASKPEPATVPGPDLLARFLTVGGAVVELRKVRFQTRYIRRPYVLLAGQTRPCDGFTWSCLGCGAQDSAETGFIEPYLDDDEKQARDDANNHATRCRSMPLGEAGGG